MLETARRDVRIDDSAHERPPLPEGLPQVELTDNARTVLMKRYVRRGADGKPEESVEGMFWRVAYHVASAERAWGGDVEAVARRFYTLLTSKSFFPNSPTFTGAGTPLGQLAACFVLPITDDMGRHASGIFQTLRDAALIQQTGGGNGFAFSRLRPKGDLVVSSAGQATGPVGFLRVYDRAFGEIAQGGCLTPETLVFTDEGLLRLDEMVRGDRPGWQEHRLRVATDEGQRSSPRGFNNGVAPVLRVTTRQGLEVAGTTDHKVKVMTGDGPAWRELQDLRPGDSVMVKLGQHMGKLRAVRRPEARKPEQAAPHFPAVLDETLAFLLGYLAGEGFVAGGEEDHRVGFSVSLDSYLMEDLPLLLEATFPGVTIHTYQKEGDRSVTFVIDSPALKEFLVMNRLARVRSSETRVPRLVRQSPKEIVGAYLRGLLEANGSLSHGYPQLTTTSQTLAVEVATLLIGLGCPVTLRAHAEGIEGSRWVVRLHSHVALEAWRENLGCDRRSRFVSCYTYRPQLEREHSYELPNAAWWLSPALEAVTLPQRDVKGRGRGLHFTATDPALRRKLLRYLRGERRLTRSAYRQLQEIHPEFASHARPLDDLWFVRVEAVEPAGESPTLDLEVDENHTYLAGGLVTHNTRRGANMGVLRVDHPDIEDFITCKVDENAITNFNISVGITDAFMRAVQDDGEWELRFPDVNAPEYRGFNGTLEQAEQAGVPIKVYKRMQARELFDKVVEHAHHNGEPGVLFLDASNRSNPVPHLYQLEATNPCGEQWLGPYENCCLGSVNLAQHLGPDATVDWEALRGNVELSTRFLEDVVEANAYVPAVPRLKEAGHRARRIGLGIMGLGDLMYHVGVRYGSPEGREFAAQVMEFVRFHAMRTSIELAEERGPFSAIEGSIYDPEDLRWEPPTPIEPYAHDFGRPKLDWGKIVAGIKSHGIRNAAQTTIAPTGTIATVAGCEGYGCEPVFALAYIRHVNDNGQDLKLTYASPAFERALAEAGLDTPTRARVIEEVMERGTCQGIEAVPEAVRDVFVVSGDITAEEHVWMQAAMQAFVDNSISKTCNFPTDATEEDVARAYLMAWELGCKGLTVYVTGSRQKVVLETKETADKKAGAEAPTAQIAMWQERKKPRPKRVDGCTYQVETPLGKAFVTINENGGSQPFEVFITTAKAGSETAAVSEAIGRLVSYILRVVSPVAPRDRMAEVVRQLAGIGGGRPLGFGPNRVLSLPDGVARALADYLGETPEPAPAEEPEVPEGQATLALQVGDLCPDCGAAALVNEEGCRKCYSCGFSEC